MRTKISSIVLLSTYIIVFFLTWTLLRVILLGNLLFDEIPLHVFISQVVKILLWIIPVILYLRFIDKIKNPFEYLKLTTTIKKGVLIGITIGLIQLILSILNVYIFGDKKLTLPTEWVWLIFIGLIEEIPFRGFLLQKFEEFMSFWPANFLQGFLFLLIHIPGWYMRMNGNLPSVTTWISIFIFGVVVGYIFKRSKSLWSCIIIHSINNFVAILVEN